RDARTAPVGRGPNNRGGSNRPCGRTACLLPTERVEQSTADRLGGKGQLIEPVIAFAWQRGRRYVEVTREIKRHPAVQQGARRRYGLAAITLLIANPFKRLVDSICISEDMMGGFPIGMLVGGAETCDPQR